MDVLILIKLNPESNSDSSNVELRLFENSGRIKWSSCDESIINNIKADQSGLAKLERMKVAIELMQQHIKKSITDGKT